MRAGPAPTTAQPQPPLGVPPPIVHTLRVRQTPTAHVPPAPQGPATCSMVQRPESGHRLPPHSRVSTHCWTAVQVAPPVQRVAVHSSVGAQ
jgi:hypothetical protein